MLVGYLEHASDYLKAFSFFVLPSIKEGLPYTVLEAGCASLPVVATTVGGIPHCGTRGRDRRACALRPATRALKKHEPTNVPKFVYKIPAALNLLRGVAGVLTGRIAD